MERKGERERERGIWNERDGEILFRERKEKKGGEGGQEEGGRKEKMRKEKR